LPDVREELSSESDVCRALIKLGMRAVFERRLEVGYAELAATPDEEHEAWGPVVDDVVRGELQRR
jgi:hypothetical protein